MFIMIGNLRLDIIMNSNALVKDVYFTFVITVSYEVVRYMRIVCYEFGQTTNYFTSRVMLVDKDTLFFVITLNELMSCG